MTSTLLHHPSPKHIIDSHYMHIMQQSHQANWVAGASPGEGLVSLGFNSRVRIGWELHSSLGSAHSYCSELHIPETYSSCLLIHFHHALLKCHHHRVRGSFLQTLKFKVCVALLNSIYKGHNVSSAHTVRSVFILQQRSGRDYIISFLVLLLLFLMFCLGSS